MKGATILSRAVGIIISAILCLVLSVIAGGPITRAAQVSEQPDAYLCENGIITGMNPDYLDTLGENLEIPLNIPASIDGVTVTGIAEGAFMQEDYQEDYPSLCFTKLNLSSSSVTSIGKRAFYGCSSLTGVCSLPSSLSEIGEEAFYGTSYSTIYLASAQTDCGKNAFGGTSLKSVICPNAMSFAQLEKAQAAPAAALTYPLDLSFVAEGSTVLVRKALYGMPLNYHKNGNGSWSEDTSFSLPIPVEGGLASDWKWVFSTDTGEAVTPSTPVTHSTLTAVRTLAKPEFTYGKDIDAV